MTGDVIAGDATISLHLVIPIAGLYFVSAGSQIRWEATAHCLSLRDCDYRINIEPVGKCAHESCLSTPNMSLFLHIYFTKKQAYCKNQHLKCPTNCQTVVKKLNVIIRGNHSYHFFSKKNNSQIFMTTLWSLCWQVLAVQGSLTRLR